MRLGCLWNSMAMNCEATYLFFNAADVDSFFTQNEAKPSSYIALTPSAALAAEAAGLSGVDERALLSDMDHLRCVAASKQALEALEIAIEECKFSAAFAIHLRQRVWFAAAVLHRLGRVLREPPYHVCDREGIWKEYLDSRQATSIIFSRIDFENIGSEVIQGNWVLTSLARLVLRLARRKKKTPAPVVLSPGPKLKLDLRQHLNKRNINHYALSSAESLFSALMRLYQFLRGHSRIFPFFSISRRDKHYQKQSAQIEGLWHYFQHLELRHHWHAINPNLQDDLAAQLGFSQMAHAFTKHIKVDAAIAFEANGIFAASLFEAASRQGLACQVFNHNFHPHSDKAAGEYVLNFLFRQRKAGIHTTEAICWFPDDLERGKKNENSVNNIPVRMTYPASPPIKKSARRFRILYAGNYQNWDQFFPLIAETSCEFLASLKEFITRIGPLTDVDLTIRIRPKTEINQALLSEIAAQYPNVTICGADEPFTEQLARHDLLVSFFSTAIGEAAQMGKPVLLWGRTSRYLQIPACSTPPNTGERSVIYYVDRTDQLVPMIIALSKYHKTPLAEEEYQNYTFPKSVPSLSDWVRTLA